MSEIRYYRGEIPCEIIKKGKKKALIKYLVPGWVGNEKEGHKFVDYFDEDIVPIRMCWRKEKNG